MKLRLSSYLFALVLLVMLIAGCGGSGSGPNPPNPPTISVAFSPAAPTSINTGATASITVGPPPVVLMDGNYVFHLAGQDGAGNYYVTGAFTVKNQVIAGGEQDM